MGIEQRKYLRLKASVPLRCKKCSFDEEQEYLKAQTVDIGGGGISFEVSEPYEPKDILKVEIDVPGWQRFFQKKGFYKPGPLPPEEPLVIICSVIRSRKSGEKYAIAASFVGIDESHQEALIQYITRHTTQLGK